MKRADRIARLEDERRHRKNEISLFDETRLTPAELKRFNELVDKITIKPSVEMSDKLNPERSNQSS